MTIKQLLETPLGEEHRTGGFQLTVKRARSTREHGKKYLQEVLWLDATGEIAGEILLPKRIPLQNNANINITVCWLQQAEKGEKKLYVEQWTPVQWTADGYEASRSMANSLFDPEDEFIIRGKVRHGVVCAYISAGKMIDRDGIPLNPKSNEYITNNITAWVDFIMTGA